MMLDPVTLAAATATLLATAFGATVTGDVGSAARRSLSRLASTVRDRLAGEADAQSALDLLETNPGSDIRRAVVAEVLEEHLHDDPAFAAELQQLVDDAQQATGVKVTATHSGLTAGGVVTQTTTSGGDMVGRDKYGGIPPDRVESGPGDPDLDL